MNPDNIVVKHRDSSQIAGLIDFGDMVYAPLINEPAVAAAYQSVSCADLFLGTTDILKGYHSANPLAGAGDGFTTELSCESHSNDCNYF